MAWRCERGDWHATGDIDSMCQYCEAPLCQHNGGWRESLTQKRQQCNECRRAELRRWLEREPPCRFCSRVLQEDQEREQMWEEGGLDYDD